MDVRVKRELLNGRLGGAPQEDTSSLTRVRRRIQARGLSQKIDPAM